MAFTLPANTTAEEKAVMGAQLSAAAYAQPPIVPQNLALVLIIVAVIIVGLATVVILLRSYVRTVYKRTTKGWGWGWEDSFALLGYATFLASSIFTIKAAFYGLGTPDEKLNESLMVRCAEYMIYSQLFYVLSMPLIKASVLFNLIRLTIEPKYRYILYTMQLFASVMGIIGMLTLLLYCRPIQAQWNPLLGKCGDFMAVVRIGYVWTAVGIATDWAYVILPWFVVRKLQMSRRSKVTVMIIIGLGGVASTASIVRAPYVRYILIAQDRLYWNGHILIWSLLESGFGLIAASLPALRSLFIGFFGTTQHGPKHNLPGKHVRLKQRAEPAFSNQQIRTIGGSSYQNMTPLQTVTSSSKCPETSGQWAYPEENTSSQSLMVQEQRIDNDKDGISDMEIGPARDNHSA